MNLVEIIQDACRDSGVNEIPISVLLNPSEEIQRLRRAADKTGRALAQDHPWQFLIRESFFTAVAGEDQGPMENIAPGFSYILNDTIWNRTRRYPIFADTPQNWQMMMGDFGHDFEWSKYRLRTGRLIMSPAPSAGDQIFFEDVTRYWIRGAASDRFMADTDQALFDDELMILGVIWRYKKSEGFAHEQEFADYLERYAQLISRDEPARTISTAYVRGRYHAFDGPFIGTPPATVPGVPGPGTIPPEPPIGPPEELVGSGSGEQEQVVVGGEGSFT